MSYSERSPLSGQEARQRLGDRVKAARLERGLTYRKAAAAAGIAPATWLRVEHGKTVRDAQLAAVISSLGLPAATETELLDDRSVLRTATDSGDTAPGDDDALAVRLHSTKSVT
jgi:transcriptional regulator with XRE-family HTH domain